MHHISFLDDSRTRFVSNTFVSWRIRYLHRTPIQSSSSVVSVSLFFRCYYSRHGIVVFLIVVFLSAFQSQLPVTRDVSRLCRGTGTKQLHHEIITIIVNIISMRRVRSNVWPSGPYVAAIFLCLSDRTSQTVRRGRVRYGCRIASTSAQQRTDIVKQYFSMKLRVI